MTTYAANCRLQAYVCGVCMCMCVCVVCVYGVMWVCGVCVCVCVCRYLFSYSLCCVFPLVTRHANRFSVARFQKNVLNYIVCFDSSVGVATRYRMDGPAFELRSGQDIFSVPRPSRPASGAHRASCAIGTGSLLPDWRGGMCYSGRGVALTSHLHVVQRSRIRGAIPPIPLCTRVACYGVTFTFSS